MIIDLFTTIPQSVDYSGSEFVQEITTIARESENNGYTGTLIYSDNRLADPWLIAGVILAQTRRILPMIALQPVYMHPYTVAKKIATLALMYQRRIALNLVAGGFVNDLKQLADTTPHDCRYERLREYTEIIQLLLTSNKGVHYEGRFYQVQNLMLQPQLPPELQPAYYLSGSSEAARSTASRLSATLIEYPEPPSAYHTNNGEDGARERQRLTGIRIGILTRDTHEAAWEAARKRFPQTREGRLSHMMAKKVSDSSWHKKLTDQHSENGVQENEPIYWMGPFKYYHTFCPYLVGNVEEVSAELRNYLELGCSCFVLDIPVSEQELVHSLHAFKIAHKFAVL